MRVSHGRLIARRTVTVPALLALCLWAAYASASNVMEMLAGSVGDMPGNVFECSDAAAKDLKPCAISFRYYPEDKPDEVNGPAKAVPGYPRWRPRRMLYLADVVHTGNFPKGSSLGPGHAWHLLWDAVRDAGTPSHVGYYAAQSQMVQNGELGNPMSSSCLPATGQYACFGRIGKNKAHAVPDSPLGPLSPVGGLSPIPVPVLVRNGLDRISLRWSTATGQESRDGAPMPVIGYQVFVYPNPVTPPSEKELTELAKPMGEVLPATQTTLEIDRTHPALAGAVTMSPALRVVFRGGQQSAYFSANGQPTGLAFPDTAATRPADDASTGKGAVPRAADIEDLFLEVRQRPAERGGDEPLLVATLELVGEPAGKLQDGTVLRLFLDYGEEGLADAFAEPGKSNTQDLTLQATLARKGEGALTAEFSGHPALAAGSRLDAATGRVVFVLPLKALTDGVDAGKLRAADAGAGRRRLLVWADSTLRTATDRVPNTNDGGAPTVAGETIKFTF